MPHPVARVAFALTTCTFAALASAQSVGAFRVVFDGPPDAPPTAPYSGRVYVAFAPPDAKSDPYRRMHDWFRPGQVLSLDVKNVAPGGEVVIDAGNAKLAFPKPFDAIEAGKYKVQAIARRNLDSPKPGYGDGDFLSEPAEIEFDAGAKDAVTLRLTKAAKRRPAQESERIKYIEMKSEKLSAFAGREVKVRAGVHLPKDWSDAPEGGKRWPALWFVGGFGGDATLAGSLGRALSSMPGGDNVLIVCPDATCFRGHSVFADSANNGPWGAMLIEEMIPAIDAKFHADGAERRFISGMSSGGWSSLWLQVTYPEHFACCWSFCPDPVDFRDFQRIDLYAPGANMYTDATGQRRGVARGREGDEPGIYYQEFVAQETVMGPGGQIHSFEAVFSPRVENGEPRPLFDRATGAVDAATAKAWEPYDIRLVLERRWTTLAPKLAGKLRVVAGGRDTFYLEGAAMRLKESLAALGSDATVEIIDGMPHAMHPPTMQAMMREIGGVPAQAAPGEAKEGASSK